MKILVFIAALGAAPSAAAQELVSLPSRPGVTQSFVILPMDGVQPKAIALLYVGGANPKRQVPSLRGFDYSEIRSPLLFVHHREDACQHTPYAAAARLAQRYELISVSGGKPAESGPCEPFHAHGYFGREAQTVDAIAGWMLKRPFPKEIQ